MLTAHIPCMLWPGLQYFSVGFPENGVQIFSPRPLLSEKRENEWKKSSKYNYVQNADTIMYKMRTWWKMTIYEKECKRWNQKVTNWDEKQKAEDSGRRWSMKKKKTKRKRPGGMATKANFWRPWSWCSSRQVVPKQKIIRCSASFLIFSLPRQAKTPYTFMSFLLWWPSPKWFATGKPGISTFS